MSVIPRPLHPWDLAPEAAIALQQELSHQVILMDQLGPVRYVAGVDVGFEQGGEVTRAAVAVLDLDHLHQKGYQPCDLAIARRPTQFPYIPGLLSFREVPAILDALAQLHVIPDLLLCDGQGTAHPRRFGIACHLGLLTNLPAIGVAKSLLVGKHAPLDPQAGAWQPLIHRGETIGAALRNRDQTNPLYISPGHKICLTTALDYVRRCTTKYRLPETTRHAHKLASGPAIDRVESPRHTTPQQMQLF
jgi:deoxyribonuclease V